MSSENPYQSSIPPKLQESIQPGYPISSPDQPPEAIESLIPFRNKPALISYYTGLFSLFPLFGLPLAILALIMGFKGLSLRSRHPNVKGAAHAWIGIIVGTLGLLINICFVTGLGLAIFAAFEDARRK